MITYKDSEARAIAAGMQRPIRAQVECEKLRVELLAILTLEQQKRRGWVRSLPIEEQFDQNALTALEEGS